MFRFAHPEYLFLFIILGLIIVLFFYANQRQRKNQKLWGDLRLLLMLTPNYSVFRPKVKFWLQVSALFFIIIVLAQPQFGTRMEEQKRKGIEVMVALDLSNSMKAQDVVPSRLDKSKQILSKILDQLVDDKVGMVVFAGDAFVQLPITVDYVSAKMYFNALSTDLVPRQGTAIGTALDLCIKSFSKADEKSKMILVITDAENHEDDAIAAAKLAAEHNIVVNVIGVGTLQGGPIPSDESSMSFMKDREGNVVISKLNETLASQIAMAGQGVYVRADNNNTAFKTITESIDKLAKSEMNTMVFTDYNEQFQSFAFIAFVLLLVDFYMLSRRNKKLSKLRFFDIKEKLQGKK